LSDNTKVAKNAILCFFHQLVQKQTLGEVGN